MVNKFHASCSASAVFDLFLTRGHSFYHSSRRWLLLQLKIHQQRYSEVDGPEGSWLLTVYSSVAIVSATVGKRSTRDWNIHLSCERSFRAPCDVNSLCLAVCKHMFRIDKVVSLSASHSLPDVTLALRPLSITAEYHKRRKKNALELGDAHITAKVAIRAGQHCCDMHGDYGSGRV